jgi:ArsR family transcriptional regulator, zinc-responsive transcriptional repressor
VIAKSKQVNPVSPSKPFGSVQDFAEAAECLKTLAHPVRLRIVQLLLHGRYTVGELAADCEIPDNVGSEHLRLLQRCGFLKSEREGRRVYYGIAEPHLEKLMACIEGRFLQGPVSRDAS